MEKVQGVATSPFSGEAPCAAPNADQRARRLGWIAYGALAAGALVYIVTIWLEVFVDTRKANALAVGVFDESHRRWRLRTTLLFLLWTIVAGMTLPLTGLLGWLFIIPAYLWYLQRVIRGAICFAQGKPMLAR